MMLSTRERKTKTEIFIKHCILGMLLDIVRHTHWKSTINTTSAIVEEGELELGPEVWLELI